MLHNLFRNQFIFGGDSEIAVNFLKHGDNLQSAYDYLIKDIFFYVNFYRVILFIVFMAGNAVIHVFS